MRLDKNSTEGDDTVDIEQDGIPDIIELKGCYKVSVNNPFTREMQEVDTWSIYCNPAKADSDGDGLTDIDDLQPMKYDTVVVEENDTNIKFNTGRVWYNITCTSYDFWDNAMYFMDMKADNLIPIEEFRVIWSCYDKNEDEEFSLEELSYIGIVNNEGSKLYMHGKTDVVRETVFQNITGRESKYYRHVGILQEEKWVECPKGTESGFFTGTVLSEADINFSNKIFFIQDISTVMNSLIQIGAVVISVILITEVTPVVLANLQALTYYVKNFGIIQGMNMYRYLGVQNLPNGILSLIRADMADGDSVVDDLTVVITSDLADGDTIADDIIYYIQADVADGDTPLDDVILGTYNDLRKLYKGTGMECHHLIEKRLINAFKGCAPTLTEGQFLSTPLNKQAHSVFTKLWRQQLPYGKEYNLQQVIEAAQKVYEDYPRLLEAVNNWLKAIGAM